MRFLQTRIGSSSQYIRFADHVESPDLKCKWQKLEKKDPDDITMTSSGYSWFWPKETVHFQHEA